VEAIADLPILNDMDADYSPQYVKLARIVRDKIESGHHKNGERLFLVAVADEYKVSVRVAGAAFEMLAANKYVARPPSFKAYRVIWDTEHRRERRR
jgi:DNA-binding GntR family transcriptional regulator